MALANVWHLRKVAEASAKPCDICYKPTTGVLITPDNKVGESRLSLATSRLTILQDYFYICQGHLKDRGFASPIVDEADAAAKKKKEELDREIELVKQEYEEKMKNKKPKKDKKGESAKEADKDNTKAEREPTNDEVAKAEQDRDDKVGIICVISMDSKH